MAFSSRRRPIIERQQEVHRKAKIGDTLRRLFRKRRRYSSLEKFEDDFDTALDLMQETKRSTTNGKVGKMR